MFYQNAVPLIIREIKPEDVLSVLYAFRETNSSSLLLNSNGGSIFNFVKFGSCIAQRNISIIGDSVVASLATIFFLCGKERVATPETIFAIHEGRFEDGSGKAITKGEAQMQALICECNRDRIGYLRYMDMWRKLVFFDELQAELISRKTSLSVDRTMDLMRQEYKFNINDALHYGIIHDVIERQQIHLLSQFGTYEPW